MSNGYRGEEEFEKLCLEERELWPEDYASHKAFYEKNYKEIKRRQCMEGDLRYAPGGRYAHLSNLKQHPTTYTNLGFDRMQTSTRYLDLPVADYPDRIFAIRLTVHTLQPVPADNYRFMVNHMALRVGDLNIPLKFKRKNARSYRNPDMTVGCSMLLHVLDVERYLPKYKVLSDFNPDLYILDLKFIKENLQSTEVDIIQLWVTLQGDHAKIPLYCQSFTLINGLGEEITLTDRISKKAALLLAYKRLEDCDIHYNTYDAETGDLIVRTGALDRDAQDAKRQAEESALENRLFTDNAKFEEYLRCTKENRLFEEYKSIDWCVEIVHELECYRSRG